MNSGRILISSILAGVMISVSTVAYLHNSSVIGALLFSVGLLSILQFKFDLFTGKVSYMKSYKEVPYIVTVLLGNIIGCLILFFYPMEIAKQQLYLALNDTFINVIVKSIFCNIMIYIAVESYHKSNFCLVVLSVVLFVMCGFNHCIARICLVIMARTFNLEVLDYLLTVILSNALGGIVFHRLRMRGTNAICKD